MAESPMWQLTDRLIERACEDQRVTPLNHPNLIINRAITDVMRTLEQARVDNILNAIK